MKDKMLREKKEYENVRDLVEDAARLYGDRPAFSYRNKPSDAESIKKSYNTLRDDVRALSTEIISRGLAGKHISVIGKLSYEWVVVYYSVLSTGSVLVPLDRDWGASELSDTAKKADVACIFCEADIAEKCAEVAAFAGIDAPVVFGKEDSFGAWMQAGREKFAGGDKSYFEAKIDREILALLVFTSGTTGKGKGVMLSQKNVITDMADVIPYIDFSYKSVGVLPPHHTYGSSVTILGQTSIGCEVYISSGIRYVAKELKLEKPGHLVLVPLYLETFYRKIMAGIKDKGKEKTVKFMIGLCNFFHLGKKIRKKLFASILENFGGNVKMIISGGAPIAQDIMDFFTALGIDVLNGYGITECAPIIAVNHNNFITKGSVGPVLPIDDVVIVDPNEDGEGEIIVKGSNVMLGYYKDEEATKDAFTDDGYFKTGDYGKLDENGVLYITGRKKNLIILSNGKNVYPEEIESELIAVPGVLETIVYEGQSKRGLMHNAIVAEIFPDKDYMEKNGIEDVKKYLQGYVDAYNKTAVAYKKIGILKVREEEFPKNTLRKIQRFKLDMSID
ncbi:MAG: AMP-binding protein [Clostridia bacterium]|nr:AMP-binding protein [Clostridia bacterium]